MAAVITPARIVRMVADTNAFAVKTTLLMLTLSHQLAEHKSPPAGRSFRSGKQNVNIDV
jgi:hypothetical protein